jgi:hypothetical protein
MTSIPLSVDALADAPFAEEEIDGLVEEVDEFAVEEAPAEEDGVWMGEETGPQAAVVEEHEEEMESPFATADSALGASTSTVEIGEPPASDGDAVDEPGSFEIDRGFDPEWSRAGWETDSPASPTSQERESPPYEVLEETPVSEETLVEEPEVSLPEAFVPPPSEETDDDGIYLNEVADDAELFEDPGLDVTSLAAGEARDIVVPVEIRAGGETRRFKLSVRLRLDPVDPD